MIFELTQVHISFLTEFKQNTVAHRRSFVLRQKDALMAPLVTAGVGTDVAQKLQMPTGRQALEDVEEPMPSRPVTCKDPGTPDQIVLEQRRLTHFPSHPG